LAICPGTFRVRLEGGKVDPEADSFAAMDSKSKVRVSGAPAAVPVGLDFAYAMCVQYDVDPRDSRISIQQVSDLTHHRCIYMQERREACKHARRKTYMSSKVEVRMKTNSYKFAEPEKRVSACTRRHNCPCTH